ncbi:MAG TPA: glutaredoxin family protein [Terriglobales bacterium]|nr:glutaredoxin family protein [Terriglobales bacterium]
MSPEISVYGTDTCEDTTRSRQHLSSRGILYRYVNIDKDPAANRKVLEWNAGKRITPTIVISSTLGTVRLAEPSDEELDDALFHRHMPSPA